MVIDWANTVLMVAVWLSALFLGYQLGARHALREEIEDLTRLQERLDRSP